MQFDFSKIINNIGVTTPPGEPIKQTEATSEIKKLQGISDHNRHMIDQATQVYKTYQENTRKSERLQAEILKGLQAGEDIEILFIKACEAIGAMTDNEVFITVAKKKLKN